MGNKWHDIKERHKKSNWWVDLKKKSGKFSLTEVEASDEFQDRNWLFTYFNQALDILKLVEKNECRLDCQNDCEVCQAKQFIEDINQQE